MISHMPLKESDGIAKKVMPGGLVLCFVSVFPLFFAYPLSFLFEGQVLHCLMALYGLSPGFYILAAMLTHFAGLFSCGLFVKSRGIAKRVMPGSEHRKAGMDVPGLWRHSTGHEGRAAEQNDAKADSTGCHAKAAA